MGGILEGIKVVDVSRILAGPYATQMLADLGADVTKIEAPWGDDTRGWGPPFTRGFDGKDVAAYFLSCNRDKTIMTFDLKRDAETVKSMIREADVVVENFKPGTLERLLGPMPSNVIVCSISAYGATGPRRDEPGYDVALQARSGIMSITGEPNAAPVKVGVAWIDVITGLNAANAILAALFKKERTGEATHIDISLWDCAIAALVNQAHNAMASGENPVAMGSAHPNLVPYRAFEAKDGWFVLGVGSDAQWATVVDRLHLEHPEVAGAWSTNQGRVLGRDAVENCVASALALHNRSDLESMLEGVPCAPVNTVLEALADPQSVARQAITQHKGVDVLASPLRFMTPQNEKSDV
ncbi:MAG: CoA transferase [Candidatus Poseidoniaceae archaeon]|jgi:crotonobetainyl-CoA:carnitine CoA-transferase CaiB-like acyl-CoA transferase|nr:CoA transferase [Candidatus Poseidoniaceae archaeon]MDP6362236.1 CoA transferase [Candidatus Poseidoniaceae archaeon]